MLRSYLKREYRLALFPLLFAAVFAAVFVLYGFPAEPALYALALCLAVWGVSFAFSFHAYARRSVELKRLTRCASDAELSLPKPSGALEADYQELVRALCADRARLVGAAEEDRRNTQDYYTLWAHQIKTPIAAMRLLLEKSECAEKDFISAELFKTGEYVDMALSYVRLGSDSSDYVLRRCALDDVVRGSIRKYARLFILKNVSVRFEETKRSILTDEKWLAFVVGQLLSNAVKYTPSGGSVHIYGDGHTLAVSDSGIGISAEDLPRVFEKGFTGLNGRDDKKATGIGLYLCKSVLEKLGCGITITSAPGRGTIARIEIPDRPLATE
ncbi:MAG: sensor histidine kinase [Oscillospiraceae bacterium]|nr:sensor histidine kinase [Oscillospiraceae bacterium]